MFLDVVLPVPLDQAFTYAAPEGPVPPLGARVLAPWGSRRLAGVVTAAHERLPEGIDPAKVKAIAAVLDPEPLLDAAMLELVAWAAAYYQAPIGEVMRCALPPGKIERAAAQRMFRLLAPPQHKLSPAQAAALERLQAAGGSMEAAELRRHASSSAVATLLRHGCLEAFETELPTTAPAWSARPRVAQLNARQRPALAAIVSAIEAAAIEAKDAAAARPILLHGVTGSGKTAVYLAAIAHALDRGYSALLLVPEIGLTPALFADFEDAFPGAVAVLHSGLGDGERQRHWRRLRSGAARVAIGTRSAVFAPVARLGLIIVDEEHDASFKQQEAPRYHGRDLAVMRAKLGRAAILLGSATPSLESYTHARAGKYRLIEMSERVESRPLPPIRILDMGAEYRARAAAALQPGAPRGGGRGSREEKQNRDEEVFSAALLAALQDRLRLGQQSLLLINRRGFAPVVLCRSCGATVMCRDCALSLTFHKRAARLVCHLCAYAAAVPRVCPGCGGEHLYFLGAGSEKIEEELARLLPAARIMRLDRDTARTRRHFESVLGRFQRGEFDILIGTQMIAKGHDVPNVTLVGVLQADLGLTFPDFRAGERTFQLLTQVAGRAGRGALPGEVFLQVMHPEHYAVTAAAAADFAAFYEKESNFRRWMHYPPFAALALAQLRDPKYDRVLEQATRVGEFLSAQAPRFPATKILGPSPALLARAKTEYRFQFLFKSASRRELSALLRELRAFARQQKFPATALIVDVDPLNL